MTEPSENNKSHDENELVGNVITEEYFRALVADYMKLTDELKALGEVVRAKRQKQNAISQIIMQYTTEKGIEGIALDGQYAGLQLVTDIQEREQNIGRKGLMEIIQTKLKDDPTKLKAIMEAVDNEKEIIEVEKVKISKTKTNVKRKAKSGKKAYGTNNDSAQLEADALLMNNDIISNGE